MRCPKSPLKHHNPKGRGSNRSSVGNKGHTWKGHGIDRRCSKCGFIPKKGIKLLYRLRKQ